MPRPKLVLTAEEQEIRKAERRARNREYQRRYRKINKEKLDAYHKEYYQREDVLERRADPDYRARKVREMQEWRESPENRERERQLAIQRRQTQSNKNN